MGRVVGEVRAFLDRHAVAGTGVVAVSGGADSVALLRALAEAGAGPLTVAHFNHRLRGDESDADEAFVKVLAEKLGLPFAAGSADVAAAGGNAEATARRLRYEFLEAVGPGWVATGHTADDQAETVLHRLIRGTGMQGLRGVAAVRGRIVRPLLGVTRVEVVAYLAALNQDYRTDSTNADPRFTRNRIRAELLPLLKTFNPAVVRVLRSVAEQADAAFEVLAADAAGLLAAAELPRAGGVLVFDAAKLEASPPRTREALRAAWERESWPRDGMTAAHWRRLAALTPGDYPGGVRLTRAGRVVRLGRGP